MKLRWSLEIRCREYLENAPPCHWQLMGCPHVCFDGIVRVNQGWCSETDYARVIVCYTGHVVNEFGPMLLSLVSSAKASMKRVYNPVRSIVWHSKYFLTSSC